MTANPLMFRATRRLVNSIDSARSLVDFPLLTPAYVPPDFGLRQIALITPPWLSPGAGQLGGFIDLVYTGKLGHLVISQGYLVPFDTRGAPEDRTGEVYVSGKLATWVDGLLSVEEPIPESDPVSNPTAKWQTGLMILGWQEGELHGCRLIGQGVSLDYLIRTAESLH